MSYYRLLPLAAMIATPAYADGFEKREIAYQIGNAIDAVQTCYVVSRGGYEANPLARAIIGRHPSCAKTIGFKVAAGVLHYLIADRLRDRDPKAAKQFQTFSLFIQYGVVGVNMRHVF